MSILRTILVALCTCSSFPLLMAQETVGGIPYSLRTGWDRSDVPTLYARLFDADAVVQEDEQRAEQGKLPLYARFQYLGADPTVHGRWYTLPNGDRVWRLRILSEGAHALELFADEFDLPIGGVLHVYDEEGEQILGGYTGFNRQPDGSFSTDMVLGETCLVEYYEPAVVRGQGRFVITNVGHAYRMVLGAKASGACQVDQACPEGTGWENQRDAVVRIRVVIPGGAGFCTGALVNNTAQDCKPYILTAFHCGEESTTANLNQYQFRFRYQRSCGTGSAPSGNSMTGCAKRADSNDGGGGSGSDFMLVETNNPIPASYQPFYAGWNVSTSAATSGRSIHHPDGDFKKISTFTSTLVNSGWGVAGSHWRVLWVATQSGHGVTEPGSSGSPLYDNNKRIVGTLTGGGSCCTLNGCGSFTGPNVADFYGKMSYHWTQNPNATNQKLKAWLDPTGSNVTVLDGSANPCAVVGIDERGGDSTWEVHPNPGTDLVTIRYPSNLLRVDRIEFSDISGRMVHVVRPSSAGQHVMNVSGWNTGTYLVSVVADGVRLGTTRLVVARR